LFNFKNILVYLLGGDFKNSQKIKTNSHEQARKKQALSASVAHLVTFMKEKTAQNLLEASIDDGHLSSLSRDDIERVSTIVNLSIEQAFSAGYVSVENTVTSLLSDD